jgi:hypothetical protein
MMQSTQPPLGPRGNSSGNQPRFDLDPEQERFIRVVAERVRTVGGAFEANLRAREGIEGKWRFLDPLADVCPLSLMQASRASSRI